MLRVMKKEGTPRQANIGLRTDGGKEGANMDSRSVAGKAVVVGAGVMGAQIAAHLANAGWRSSLLDIVPGGAGDDAKSRNALAAKGLERAQKAKPAAFFLSGYAGRIRLGNTADNLDWIREADWVIEAVVEKPEIKRQV